MEVEVEVEVILLRQDLVDWVEVEQEHLMVVLRRRQELPILVVEVVEVVEPLQQAREEQVDPA